MLVATETSNFPPDFKTPYCHHLSVEGYCVAPPYFDSYNLPLCLPQPNQSTPSSFGFGFVEEGFLQTDFLVLNNFFVIMASKRVKGKFKGKKPALKIGPT